MSLSLSTARRDLIRSLGVEDEFPKLAGYYLPATRSYHLDPDCVSPEVPVLVQVPLLDLRLDDTCSWCRSSPSWSRACLALQTLRFVMESLEKVLHFEELLASNWREQASGPSPTVLGELVKKSDFELANNLRHLSEGPDSVFVAPAANLVADRFRAVQAGAIELLRSPEGQASVKDYLRDHRALLPSGMTALFVLEDGTMGELRAAVHAFGVELAPGRFLLRSPSTAVAALYHNAICSAVSVEGFSDEVLATAVALWEPYSQDPLGSGPNCLEAAEALLGAAPGSS